MKKLFERIRMAVICRREGFVNFYCPGCGKWIAAMHPTQTGRFYHDGCGTSWIIAIDDKENR